MIMQFPMTRMTKYLQIFKISFLTTTVSMVNDELLLTFSAYVTIMWKRIKSNSSVNALFRSRLSIYLTLVTAIFKVMSGGNNFKVGLAIKASESDVLTLPSSASFTDFRTNFSATRPGTKTLLRVREWFLTLFTNFHEVELHV